MATVTAKAPKATMTKKQLLAVASQKGIKVSSSLKKAEIEKVVKTEKPLNEDRRMAGEY